MMKIQGIQIAGVHGASRLGLRRTKRDDATSRDPGALTCTHGARESELKMKIAYICVFVRTDRRVSHGE